MYIKFCRGYAEDKKEDVKESLSSKLSVELEAEKGTPTEGRARRYPSGCLFLSILCLILLVVVIILSMKLVTGSKVCPERQETPADPAIRPSSPSCSYEQCQAQYPSSQRRNFGCRQCASGWLSYGRSCFYLSTFRLSWDESQRNCTASGGSLAVIGSQTTQNFLTKEGDLKYWIGLRQKGDRWAWVNHSAVQQSYWSKDETSGDCGILDSTGPQDKNWIKASCQAYTYFICQLQF
ncbi:early activation antigen CD69 isoform X2 [Betta splendens]|uniref:Early activation antigen CD69 isoform X2 n=1 Tax=Betta splendens TaxID=158456 RepID=A0A6P7KR22_BETSP|nr:early activation antigen CD69 isoform X2 [Betta splendens]